jgi:hypothetical protein
LQGKNNIFYMKKLRIINYEKLNGGGTPGDRCSLAMGLVTSSGGIVLSMSWNPIGWAAGGVIIAVGLGAAYFCK